MEHLNSIIWLESEIRKKDRLRDSFITMAATQSKHITYLRSFSHLAPSQVASDSAATLPWLPSLNADIAPTGPNDAAAESSGSSAGKLVAGASDIPITAAAGDGDDPGASTGTGLLPVRTSTPRPSRSPWTEVRRGPKGDLAAGKALPPVGLSNRFAILLDEAPVHPGDSLAAPAPTAHHAAATSSPPAAGYSAPTATAVSSPTPPAAAPSPPSAPSTGWTLRRSTTGNRCRRMLQEAVIRRSGALSRSGPPPPSNPVLPSSTQAGAECPKTTLRPLFPPTTLVVGDSITRGIRFLNAISHCIPGVTVPRILEKLPGLLSSLPSSINRVVVHVGCNDVVRRPSELLKKDFCDLMRFFK